MILNTDQKPRGIKSVLFDFDGTLSLVRQGWQDVMIPYFAEVLSAAPKAGTYREEYEYAKEFIELTTGKQTIYQCMQLDDEVVKRGGKSVDPYVYKQEYSRRLLERIEHRRQKLRSGEMAPDQMVVPGTRSLLEALTERGVNLYLASGTDEEYVLEEANLIDVAKYFKGNIFGAKDDLTLNSKAMVIRKILSRHHLSGASLAGFGDGYVEIENVKEVGGIAIGVASNEEDPGAGMNEWKKNRLTAAGADAIIPDFNDLDTILEYLFGEGDMNEAK